MADPSPAPCCTRTSCPWSTSSRTPEGVMATRYSSVLISVGTPTFMDLSSRRVGDDHAMRLHHVHRGSGEPLLLVHGIGDSNRMWSRVLGRLARAHEVFAVDAPGF